MATHTRDVAWRSLQSVFQALPADAIVDIVKIGQPPPAGVAMTVKVEITALAGDGAELRTWAAPAEKSETKKPKSLRVSGEIQSAAATAKPKDKPAVKPPADD